MKKIQKMITYMCLTLTLLFSIPMPINAETITVGTASHANMRTGPSTDYARTVVSDGSLGVSNGEVKILETVAESPVNSACDSNKWYHVSSKDSQASGIYDAYICADSVSNVHQVDSSSTPAPAPVVTTPTSSYNFEAEMAKFPSDYQAKLRVLHDQHPNWEFYAENTNLYFDDAVNAESYSEISLVSISKRENYHWLWLDSPNYDWRTDTTMGRWAIPSKSVVAYYMDSRNYLSENKIFAFLSNSFRGQNEQGVKTILNGTFMSGSYNNEGTNKSYSSTFYEAGVAYNVSPYMLASRSKQEVTLGGEPSGSASGTYGNYTGYYNFYNIGATGNTNAITNGLIYAIDKGWNTPYKAIFGGAQFLSSHYIARMQDNLYFQKFNVISQKYNSNYKYYANQYMQNIEAPWSESESTYKGYAANNMLNKNLIFDIPVYKNMYATSIPSVWSVAGSGNPNNWLIDLRINGTSVKNFAGDSDQEYTYNIAYDTTSVNISVVKPTQGGSGEVPSTVAGIGNVSLNKNEGIDTPIRKEIVVTAQNGWQRKYVVKFKRDPEPPKDSNGNIIFPSIGKVLDNLSIRYNDNYVSGYDYGTSYDSFDNLFRNNISFVSYSIAKNGNNGTGHFATGDKIIFNINNVPSSFNYVLYGDLNGDGEINLSDLVHCRKILLGSSNLSGANRNAADINKDGQVNLTDLVLLRKQILGTNISQR